MCKKELEESNFSIKRETETSIIYQSYCRDCNKLYQKEHYSKNTNAYKKKEQNKRKEYRIVNKQHLLTFFASGCKDCGETDLVVLECDHVSQSIKRFDIATAMYKTSEKVFLDELNKCEPVCANCHKRRTAKQFGSWRLNTVL